MVISYTLPHYSVEIPHYSCKKWFTGHEPLLSHSALDQKASDIRIRLSANSVLKQCQF